MILPWRAKRFLVWLKTRLDSLTIKRKLIKVIDGFLSEDDEVQGKTVEELRSITTMESDHYYIIGLLGVCYLFGLGVDLHPERARELLLKAEKKKVPFANFFLGWMQKKGIGAIEDVKRANELFHIAIEQYACPFSMIEVATSTAQNEDLMQKVYNKALKHYEKAANHQIPEAYLGMGWLYQYRLFWKPNHMALAVQNYHLAAEAGLERAQFNMGVLYEAGNGVGQDPKKALEYYQMAADAGLPEAQFNLAVYYMNGDIVPLDLKMAFLLTKKAAKRGLAEAQYKLGLFYDLGIGVQIKPEKSLNYFEAAANQGHPAAKEKLACIRTNPVEISNSFLKKKERKSAQERVIISMAPINSSGDIYHILSFLMYAEAENLPTPDVVLCHDAEDTEEESYDVNDNSTAIETCIGSTHTAGNSKKTNSDINTKDQVERALTLALVLGYGHHFKNPLLEQRLLLYLKVPGIVGLVKDYLGHLEAHTLRLTKTLVSRMNARQSKLEKCFQHETEVGPIHYTDQRALTTYLSQFFRRDRQKSSAILEAGYRKRNPLEISDKAQLLLKQYAQYWMKKIEKSKKNGQPLMVFHLRFSGKANKEQKANDEFIIKLVHHLQDKGYLIWFIMADSRKNPFSGISKNRITPFSKPLKKHEHFETLDKFERELDALKPNFDFGKLKHLELILALKGLKFLKGIFGNTSGTLDLAAFIGHNVYNIHHFNQSKISYQDYRILLQMSFLSLENYPSAAEKSRDVNNSLCNFDDWLKSKNMAFVPPTIPFEEPNFDKAEFRTLLFSKKFENGAAPKLLDIPGASRTKKFVQDKLGGLR